MYKILVALSGGIDSTMSAYILKRIGFHIEGVYMKLHNIEKEHSVNIENVKKVADYLGINYRIIDLKNEFEKNVFKPFINEYIIGKTPNPCVVCNRNIKLGKLLEYAKSEGFDKLSTGHYAKIINNKVCEARDKSRDQSYFLAMVKKDHIKDLIFPLGDWLKDEVREFSKNISVLKEIEKNQESREICFVESTYIDILKDYVDVNKEGDVVDNDGNVIGMHKGYMHYTIGKRRGFVVKGATTPHYVKSIDYKNNRIVVGKKEDLLVKKILLKDFATIKEESEFETTIKIRYRSKKTRVLIKKRGDVAKVEFLEDVYAVAPGQYGVLYDDECIVGRGVISLL